MNLTKTFFIFYLPEYISFLIKPVIQFNVWNHPIKFLVAFVDKPVLHFFLKISLNFLGNLIYDLIHIPSSKIVMNNARAERAHIWSFSFDVDTYLKFEILLWDVISSVKLVLDLK